MSKTLQSIPYKFWLQIEIGENAAILLTFLENKYLNS